MATTSNLSYRQFSATDLYWEDISAVSYGRDYAPTPGPEPESRKIAALRARIAKLERDRGNYRLLGARLRSFFRTRNCRQAVDRMVFNIELIEGTVTEADAGALVDVIAQALSEYEESRPEHER